MPHGLDKAAGFPSDDRPDEPDIPEPTSTSLAPPPPQLPPQGGAPTSFRQGGEFAPAPLTPAFFQERTLINQSLLTIDAGLSSAQLDRIGGTLAQDPAILNLLEQDFIQQVTKTTLQMMEEQSALRLIRYVSDEEAVTRAAMDRYADTWGSMISANHVFQSAETQRQTWTEIYLDSGERRQQVADEFGAQFLAIDSPGINEDEDSSRGAWTAPDTKTNILGEPIIPGVTDRLRKTGATWVQQGNNLAIRFFREGESWDVLVRLKPGTTIETHPQAIAAFSLAEQGKVGAIDPTSDEVPRRRTRIGSMFKGFDDAMAGIERRGLGLPTAVANSVIGTIRLEGVTAPLGLSPIAEEGGLEASITELSALPAFSDKARRDNAIAQIAREFTLDEDSPMRDRVVLAGFGLDQILAQEPDVLDPTADITELAELLEAEEDETSQLTKIFQEDVFEPTLQFLETWDNAIHFIGIIAMDAISGTPEDWINVVDEIRANGIGVLSDPELLITLVPGIPDPFFITEQWQNIQNEGFPLAFDAYIESVQDIGDIATYWGIDEDSALAGWVNAGASIAFDPITYLTMGGGASWRHLLKGVTSPGGAERLIASRPMRSAVRQLVEKQNPRVVASFYAGGMDSVDIARLVRIGVTEYGDDVSKLAAAKEANEVLRGALNNGTWLPSGPGRVLHRKSYLGLGELSARTGRLRGGGSSKIRQVMTDLMTRSSRHRYTYVSDREFLGEVIALATARHPDDALRFSDDIISATDAHDLFRTGDEAATALQGELDQTTGLLGEALGETADFRKTYGTVRSSVKDLDDTIARLGDELTAGADVAGPLDALKAQRDDALRQVAENEDSFQDILGRIKDLRKQQTDLLSRMERVAVTGADNTELEFYVHQYYDEWGKELGLDVVEGGKHPFFPDRLPLRDWTPIVGDEGMTKFRQAVAPLSPFGEEAATLKRLGGPVTGTTKTPVSPYEIAAWRATPSQGVWDKLHFSAPGRGFKIIMDGIQKIWSASVLFNVGTSIRSNLDETFRFFEDIGGLANSQRDMLKVLTLRGAKTPEGRAWVRRNLDNAFTPSRGADWKMVPPGEKGQWVHAERWVNGLLLNKDALFGRQFQAYARAIAGSGGDDDVARALWREWWQIDGHKLSRKTTAGGDEITDRVAFDAMEGGLTIWGIDDAQRARLIAAGANGEKLPGGAASAKDWKRFPSVPAEVTEKNRGIVDRGFDALYGNPQNRRGGAIYDRNFEWSYNALSKRFEGRIMDEDWLLNRFDDLDFRHAQEMIAAGNRNPRVRQLLAETGMRLERDIHQAAMRWAAANTDDMMYTFGATSVLGRKAARFMPFGRAQVDYFQWWWKKLTQPTQITGFGPVARGPLSRVNVRLIDRMAHLAKLREPGERADPLSPAGIVEQYSFLPTSLDNQTLIENSIGLGPLPGWTLNLPNVPDDVRDKIQWIFPGHATFTEPYDDYGDAIVGLRDQILPKRGLSVWATGDAIRQSVGVVGGAPIRGRGETSLGIPTVGGAVISGLGSVIDALLPAAATSIGWNGEDPLSKVDELRLNSVMNRLIVDSDFTPYVRDQFAFRISDWLVDQGHVTPSEDPTSQIMQTWGTMLDEATMAGLRDDSGDFWKRMIGVPFQGGSDFQVTATHLPAGNYAAEWFDLGYVSDAKRDSIMTLLPLVQSGEATDEQRKAFGDDVMESLFTLLPREERVRYFAENPQSNVNLVSWFRVVSHLVPSGTEGISGNRIVVRGEEGRELRAKGKREGWLVVRDDIFSYALDAHYAFQRSVRERTSDVYDEAINGLELWQTAVRGETDDQGNRVELVATYADDAKALMARSVTIEAEWWERNKVFLNDLNGFNDLFPDEARADLIAGNDTTMNLGEFRSIFREVKDRYDFKTEVDQNIKAKLHNIGDDSRTSTPFATNISNLDGLEPVTSFSTEPLSFYGRDLFDEIEEAVKLAEKNRGWVDPTEWPEEGVFWTDADGEDHEVTLEGLRERFRMAITLSSIDNYDLMNFTEAEYQSSKYGRWLGDLDWEPPEPPPLNQIALKHVTTGANIDIIDGDTITIMGDEGDVIFRLIGLNAAESTEPGYDEARTALADIIDAADEVTIAVWNKELFGRKQRQYTTDGGAVVHRDRYFGWLYIDGIPLFDPLQFSPTNIRGAATGGSVPDYAALLERERQKRGRR